LWVLLSLRVPGVASLDAVHREEPRRLAFVFAVIYFAQAMAYLPGQTVNIELKEHVGLSAAQMATFSLITTTPWFLKPLYGLLSDFLPVFGSRRKNYLLIASGLASTTAVFAAINATPTYLFLLAVMFVLGLGLAFSDVVIDALMVEKGRAFGMIGTFQSVQWTAMYVGVVLVGLVGGHFAEARNLRSSYLLAAAFPLTAFCFVLFRLSDTPVDSDVSTIGKRTAPIWQTLRSGSFLMVTTFIFLFNFSPSFGASLFYYQTDHLKFSQQLIGGLLSTAAVGSIVGSVLYTPISRAFPLRLIVLNAVILSAVGTLAYLLYRGPIAAFIIEASFGILAMVTRLALFDLAARSCPIGVEGTFFAGLMTVYAFGQQGSDVIGGYIYGTLGYVPLVVISAAATALVLVMFPYIPFQRLQESQTRMELIRTAVVE